MTVAWAERYRALSASADAPAWLTAARDDAWARFTANGLTRFEEAFKYTKLAPLAKQDFQPSVATAIDEAALPEPYGVRIVFIDGRYSAALSQADALPQGVAICPLRDALKDERLRPLAAPAQAKDRHTLYQLNAALADNGVAIEVAGDADAGVIELVYLATAHDDARTAQPRVLVDVGPHAKLTLIERHRALGEPADFVNLTTELRLARGAKVEHLLLQRASSKMTLATGTYATLAENATFTSHAVHLGGSLVRADIHATLAGRGAHCGLYGLHLAGDGQHIDTQTRIEHAVPDTTSDEHYRSVVDRGGRSVFNGKVVIQPGADRSDAQQYNANLLLDKLAEADTKPELEIYADDVKATHGATVGKLDDEAMFYLRSRGIGEAEARAVLVWAFADSVLTKMPLKEVKHATEAAVLARLPHAATIQAYR